MKNGQDITLQQDIEQKRNPNTLKINSKKYQLDIRGTNRNRVLYMYPEFYEDLDEDEFILRHDYE